MLQNGRVRAPTAQWLLGGPRCPWEVWRLAGSARRGAALRCLQAPRGASWSRRAGEAAGPCGTLWVRVVQGPGGI